MREFVDDGLVKISDDELLMTQLGREFTPRICENFDSYAKRDLFDKKYKKVITLAQESLHV